MDTVEIEKYKAGLRFTSNSKTKTSNSKNNFEFDDCSSNVEAFPRVRGFFLRGKNLDLKDFKGVKERGRCGGALEA